ncbi:hypothetical protein [Thiorhodococcus mannitoliphagus]|nr:hypothetical protein [Thiorhodococcus mannitoliphagus]
MISEFDLYGPIIFDTGGAQLAYAGSDGAGWLPIDTGPLHELIISEHKASVLDDYLSQVKHVKLTNSFDNFIKFIQQRLTLDNDEAKAIFSHIDQYHTYPSACYYYIDSIGNYVFSEWPLELYRSLIDIEPWETMSDENLELWLDTLEGPISIQT